MAGAERPDAGRTGPLIAACLTATLAFWAYTQTLLPGVDLGDTGGFQAAVLWPETSARRAYPLYYALAGPFVGGLSRANPARGLNLFSAVWAALATGLVVWIGALVARSVIAGIAAGLLLAFSYTFWSQAVIAEVYSLHLAFVAACLVALHAFALRPTTGRLAALMGVYALSFGNHLSMILLLIPFTVFLLQVHPHPRQLFRPRVIALAVAIAAAGALQYSGNFLSVWSSIDAPLRWTDRVGAFWFDTTKADWRESMVLGVSRSEVIDRLAMWTWDARQQFGLPGIALAVAGVIRLWTIARPWAVLVVGSYAICTAFALTYNVGDTHVFLLTGHLLTALAAAAVLAPVRSAPGSIGPRVPAVVVAAAVLAYAGWRGWDTWPAVDRSQDRRADVLVARLAQGVSDRTAILAARMNWQSENALLYSARYERRDLGCTRLADVMPYFPFLVRDNHEIGRDIVLTAEAASDVVAAFGSAFPLVHEEPPGPSLAQIVDRLPRGTPYVLTLLTPSPDEGFDPAAFEAVLRGLTGGRMAAHGEGAYEVWTGLSGEASSLHQSSDRPFRRTVGLLGDRVTIRMESWLPFDTFRRGGFGHVLRGREHVLTIERGASLAYFQPDGMPAHAYMGGIYAPAPRFRIPAGATLRLAALPR